MPEDETPPPPSTAPAAGEPAGDSGARWTRASDLLPTVATPPGGGAIRGLGERFAVSSATGAGSLTVPLPLSPGRSGFTPPLRLSYESGAGNGPLGFGWGTGVPAITRKTDQGLPRYLDADESDVFLLSGSDDLVPVLDGSVRRVTERTVHGVAYRIAYYRPRIEADFARIERWTARETGRTHWRTRSRDNITSLYGYDPGSALADPADPNRVFSWHLCRTWDDKGNAAVYDHVAEDGVGVDTGVAPERHRSSAQVYLKSVRYGNLAPYRPDWTVPAETPMPPDWLFTVVLDHGDHTAVPPAPEPDAPWPVRPDPFSAYRSTFDVRTHRRVRRFLFFHDFPDEPTAGARLLVRSVELTYADERTPPGAADPVQSLLVAVTQTGHLGAVTRSLPPLELDYSPATLHHDVRPVDRAALGNLPEGIDDARYRFVDLDGDGCSGILSTAPAAWYYQRNLSPATLVAEPGGDLAARVRFGPLEPVAAVPSRTDLTGVHLLDLTGAGRLDVADLAGADPGYFERTADAGFAPFHRFDALPALDWSDPNLRFIDLTGDGLADLLLTENGVFTTYAARGGAAGFDPPRSVWPGWDEEAGPAVVLSDGTETIFTTDLSGDGLHDIVRVRNGETCYWPNLGYGRFGAKVTMDAAPRFADEQRFDPRRVLLADVDGSGAADLLYVGEQGVTVWFNRSGNAWSAGNPVAAFPAADLFGSVQALDLLGTGTACLVWSSPRPADAEAPLRYVDLMGGRKPYLLTGLRNNLGAETRIGYAPSTRFQAADALAGTPWTTRVPFPVQVVERCETLDHVGRNRLVSRYAYHHGHFDVAEREFLGFGRVDQWDTEEFRPEDAFDDGDTIDRDARSFSPPTRTSTWFHTGVIDAAAADHSAEYWNGDAAATRPPAVVLPPGLTAVERREAHRALMGQPQRIEVFGEDGTDRAANPYSVTEQNCTIVALQPIGPNAHAVFLVHPRETLSYHYERGPADPRVDHRFVLDADQYGNVLRTVSAGYPRRDGRPAPEPTLAQTTRDQLAYDQARLHVVAAQYGYTNAVDTPDAYRTPVGASTLIAEITGVTPAAGLFGFAEIDAVWTGTLDLPYEQLPASDITGSGVPATGPARRPIERHLQRYRSDDLATLLPAGQLEPLALDGESYQAALTPGLLTAVLGSLVTPAILTAAGYVRQSGDPDWWIPSGQVRYSPGDADTAAQELAAASAGFFRPRRAVDPFGAVTRIDYDGYALLPVTATDPVGNTTRAGYDYRVLAPAVVAEPNGNRAATAFDVLGLPTATAVLGKETDGFGDELTGFTADLPEAALTAAFTDPLADPAALLGQATTRLLYDVDAYHRAGSPPAVYLLARETHVSDLVTPPYPGAPATTAFQHSITYCDGVGREIQRKSRVAPGPLTDGGPAVSPRWAGTGWTVLDNKGRAVRTYEPFFSATAGFEFAAKTGVSTVVCHDPAGRVVARLLPDSSWSKTVFDQWSERHWDGDDTSLIADPRTDADVGPYFQRLLGGDPFTSWHDQRTGGSAAEQAAAAQAATAAGTPTTVHYDALGRACLAVADAGGGVRLATRTALDIDGRTLAVTDALGRHAEEYVFRDPLPGGGFRYLAASDLAGTPLYHVNADQGARLGLSNAAGSPVLDRDARGHVFRTVYDAAQRPTARYVSAGGAPETVLNLWVYGEGQAGANLCGRVFRHYDQAGYLENTAFDYAGNLTASARQLATSHESTPDWTPLAGLTDATALDTAARAANLIPAGDRFAGSTVFDALHRPVQQITPHAPATRPDVIRPGYDEGARQNRLDVWLQPAAAPAALLDPATADLHAVTGADHNARGQRTSVTHGNGTTSAYTYDPLTFRLTRLTTTRPSAPAAVQDLTYSYDPVGNITRIQDDAQDAVFFANQRVEPSTTYTYDPLYRLTSATGREHLGQTGGGLSAPPQVTADDSSRMGLPQPGDGNAMGTYTETYGHDPVGNLLTTTHRVASGGWTRRYAYGLPSRIDPAETGNRLSATSLPGDVDGGPYSATYDHDEHGNMTRMPHLPVMTWDEDDRLRATTRQVVTNGTTPPTTYYAYDETGARVRKTTNGQSGAPVSERIYLGGKEIYRELALDGTITLVRETLNLNAGGRVVARVETRTAGTDPSPARLVRYQHGNHLGSAVLELDETSAVISYEEYFPHGATAYQAVAGQTGVPKRYRYAGRERDEENDLDYHGARYYAPWLGRWTACDPAGMTDGTNLFAYCANNPIVLVDVDGLAGRDPTAKEIQTLADRGITDPAVVRRLVNLQPPRPPKPGQGGSGGTGGGSSSGGGGGATPKGGGGGDSHGTPSPGTGTGGTGGTGTDTSTGAGSGPGTTPGGSDPSGTGTTPGAGNGGFGGGGNQAGGAPGGRADGTGHAGADAHGKPLTEMDYAVLLASLLSPYHAGEQSEDGESGGIPGGQGHYASQTLQGVYIAVNLIFTFAGEAVESALRKAGNAIKAGLARVWSKIGPAVLDAVAAPVFAAMGAGGLGGGGGGKLLFRGKGARPIGAAADLEAEEMKNLVIRKRGKGSPPIGAQQGREFKEEWMQVHEFDPNQPAHVRGWLKNERRRLAGPGGGKSTTANPPGYVMGHKPGTPAREGFDYSNSTLTGQDINATEELLRRKLGRP